MPQKTIDKKQTALWGWQATAARSPTNILQVPASENKHFADLLKFTPRRGSQLSRAWPHLRPLATTRSNQPTCPQSPPPLNQRHKLWPTANPRKPRLASKHRTRTKPRPPFSPPTKHLAPPRPLGQAAQPPQRRRHGYRKGGDHLTAPLPQASTRLIFKVPRSSGCAAAQLACDSSASRFRCPKSIRPRHFCFFFSPSARFLPLPLPNDCVSGTACFPKSIVGEVPSP